ncbi:hypothetical protein [Microtetraspora glauca]|uniref:Uncharacterized protein n=1 Tax=Microtetraspora glauca TaxID=1996 RepID=A0ABV3GTJ9_MICGL
MSEHVLATDLWRGLRSYFEIKFHNMSLIGGRSGAPMSVVQPEVAGHKPVAGQQS